MEYDTEQARSQRGKKLKIGQIILWHRFFLNFILQLCIWGRELWTWWSDVYQFAIQTLRFNDPTRDQFEWPRQMQDVFYKMITFINT